MPNADQCRSMPIKILALIPMLISDQCHDFDRHWSALGNDRGSPVYAMKMRAGRRMDGRTGGRTDRQDHLYISSPRNWQIMNYFIITVMYRYSKSDCCHIYLPWPSHDICIHKLMPRSLIQSGTDIMRTMLWHKWKHPRVKPPATRRPHTVTALFESTCTQL